MLLDFDHGGKLVTKVFFQGRFNGWKARMSPADIATVKAEIHRLLSLGDVQTTSWMPGSDWSDSPFEPIYAALRDETWSAMCFGLFVLECVLERREDWGFGHYEKASTPIKGRTYFKLVPDRS